MSKPGIGKSAEPWRISLTGGYSSAVQLIPVMPKPLIIVLTLAFQFSATVGRSVVPPDMAQVSFGGFCINQSSAKSPAYKVSTPVSQVALNFSKTSLNCSPDEALESLNYGSRLQRTSGDLR
ncbi:hypothetical protein [Acinetobacter sp.]|uniref:hypothetical protein n=1 Tax=Acinetobacter sp. TaxID=472 RepID=UPI00388D4868